MDVQMPLFWGVDSWGRADGEIRVDGHGRMTRFDYVRLVTS